MKILSLFDGMACGMLAMMASETPVKEYIAYEIDQYCTKTSKHNFPDIKQNGDVFAADFTQYKGIDWLIGGSPCTYWSIAQTKNRETQASGMGWELFSQYIRALHEATPKFFIYENNKSMSKAIRESITETFGFEPICINSALVSAQNRNRLYWCGIRQEDGTYKKADIQQPQDREIMMKDILETAGELFNPSREGKAPTLTASYYKISSVPISEYGNEKNRPRVAEPICVAQRGRNPENPKPRVAGLPTEQMYEARADQKSNTLTTVQKDNMVAVPIRYCTEKNVQHLMRDFGSNGDNGKSPTVTTPIYKVENGMITVKEKQYPIKLVDGYYIIRKLTVRECMRLQTVPEWYEFPVSNSHAYKMLGNGWTVEVIAHLIREMKKELEF